MAVQTVTETPKEIRERILPRCRGATSVVTPGYVQANLAILPQDLAFDFPPFCQRNQKPCPLLEVIEPSGIESVLTTPGSDIRTDSAGYRFYENGAIRRGSGCTGGYWRDNVVSFLPGCGFQWRRIRSRGLLERLRPPYGPTA
jgi:uncharacterized protein YcsI (UPF0317 family)